METTITSAEVCELAEALTYDECEARGIEADEYIDEELHYTYPAQVIFDKYYDLICEKLGHS